MNNGTTVLVRLRVHEYATWKEAFDGHEEARVRHGCVGHRILRDTRDPSALTLLLEFTSLGGATGFARDVSLLDAVRAGGVEGGPHGGGLQFDYLEQLDTVAEYAQ